MLIDVLFKDRGLPVKLIEQVLAPHPIRGVC